MFDTTAGKLSTGIKMLAYVSFDHGSLRTAIGRKLHATGKPYSACVCDHERDGWTAAHAAAIDARVDVREMVRA